MYPRHSIIVHRSLGKISPVAYYIHRKEDKIRPPPTKSPFLMINLHLFICHMSSPGLRCLRGAVTPALEVYNLARKTRLTSIK